MQAPHPADARAADKGDVLVLASQSPRRAALLTEAGIPFVRGAPPGVDETPPPGATAPEAARRIAERKARAAAALWPGRTVLTADTVVFLGTRMLGKPRDADDAKGMLARLAGRRHGVATGTAVARDARLLSAVDVAWVTFARLEPAWIEAYVAGGEPLDKAGGYAIQGAAGARVARLEGGRDTVIGLPLARVRTLLAALDAEASG